MPDDRASSDPEDFTPTITSCWNLNGQSWQVGRTSNGTPILNGSTDVPRLTVPAFLFGMGTLVLLPPAFLYFCTADGLATTFVASVCISLSLLCIVTGIKCMIVRSRILRLVPAAEMARMLKSDTESVQNIATHLNLNPSYIVNGQPYYKPGDFDNVTVLLRPSTSPDESSLLRSITQRQDAGDELADRLLRPITE